MENLTNCFSVLAWDCDNPGDDEERARLSAVTMPSSKKKGKSAVKKQQRKEEENQGKGKEAREASVPQANKTGNQPEQQDPCTSLSRPLVWIDLEMTGLEIEKDRILEIACIITDGKLATTVEGPDLIINQPEDCLANMGEWCQNHHSASGLVEAVRKSRMTEQEAEQQVVEFVQRYTASARPLLAGNSVYVDFMFLRKYMPNLAALFSHVLVDVSSIKALCFRWFPKDAEKAPDKKNSHRALDDIKDSIAELKYLKKAIFKSSRQ